MKRKEILKALVKFINENNDNPDLTVEKAAEIYLDEIERLGLVPVSKYSSLFSSAVIYDWEENVDDDRRDRELHRQVVLGIKL